ncbi:MAG: hypothetical protein U1E13_05445 [Methylophilaceae bacterium]|nr:hypothetical protein [Methylophilaceae bacterium]
MNTKQLVASLLLSQLLIAGVSHAEQISGRLFTTPNERANLDYLRQTSKAPSPEQYEDEENATVAPALPSSVSMQGFVKRGDGKKGTVWVNNQPVQENSDTGEVHVGKLPRAGGQVQINIPASGRNVNLKAGQVYMPETDSISEDKARATDLPKSIVQDAGAIGAIPSDQP